MALCTRAVGQIIGVDEMYYSVSRRSATDSTAELGVDLVTDWTPIQVSTITALPSQLLVGAAPAVAKAA